MVERLNGIQEVGSSNLLPSTKSDDDGKAVRVTARFLLPAARGARARGNQSGMKSFWPTKMVLAFFRPLALMSSSVFSL